MRWLLCMVVGLAWVSAEDALAVPVGFPGAGEARFAGPPGIRASAWSPDGGHLAVAGNGGLAIYRSPDGALVDWITCQPSPGSVPWWTPDSAVCRLVIHRGPWLGREPASARPGLLAWRAQGGAQRQDLPRAVNPPGVTVPHPDGSAVVGTQQGLQVIRPDGSPGLAQRDGLAALAGGRGSLVGGMALADGRSLLLFIHLRSSGETQAVLTDWPLVRLRERWSLGAGVPAETLRAQPLRGERFVMAQALEGRMQSLPAHQAGEPTLLDGARDLGGFQAVYRQGLLDAISGPGGRIAFGQLPRARVSVPMDPAQPGWFVVSTPVNNAASISWQVGNAVTGILGVPTMGITAKAVCFDGRGQLQALEESFAMSYAEGDEVLGSWTVPTAITDSERTTIDLLPIGSVPTDFPWRIRLQRGLPQASVRIVDRRDGQRRQVADLTVRSNARLYLSQQDPNRAYLADTGWHRSPASIHLLDLAQARVVWSHQLGDMGGAVELVEEGSAGVVAFRDLSALRGAPVKRIAMADGTLIGGLQAQGGALRAPHLVAAWAGHLLISDGDSGLMFDAASGEQVWRMPTTPGGQAHLAADRIAGDTALIDLAERRLLRRYDDIGSLRAVDHSLSFLASIHEEDGASWLAIDDLASGERQRWLRLPSPFGRPLPVHKLTWSPAGDRLLLHGPGYPVPWVVEPWHGQAVDPQRYPAFRARMDALVCSADQQEAEQRLITPWVTRDPGAPAERRHDGF